MLLQDKQSGSLVEVLDVADLVNPSTGQIQGRIQAGQEEQDPEDIAKEQLVFPSGEELPRCWVDQNYQRDSKMSA
ncbi:acetyltransferase [Oscillatoria sp. FACHB-1407]|uniref:acetyltransferase n=1 Tax=Oscillatoria sp. FACHB-1407 TaxID=2692847 RepID=UPI00168530D2|nr:acetyltransferase [Oscillatoria sp. FACHB-1407]MBD2460879.1 acetyltransferase [Oscillatoria sp. FACHB-1407]